MMPSGSPASSHTPRVPGIGTSSMILTFVLVSFLLMMATMDGFVFCRSLSL